MDDRTDFLFHIKILNSCSGMPALQTSQCQNSLDSLSRWMACCAGNTTDRAPPCFSGSEVKSDRFGRGETRLHPCYPRLLCLCLWGFHTPFSSTAFYVDFSHLGLFLWTHITCPPVVFFCVALGRVCRYSCYSSLVLLLSVKKGGGGWGFENQSAVSCKSNS